MIADLSDIILSYSKQYTKSSKSTFVYNGITYNNIPVTSTIYGIMTPLDDTDIERLSNLGYSVVGKQLFFVPGTETLLTENDVIIDSNNIEWVVLPIDGKGAGMENWIDHGNFVQYTLSRDTL